MAAAKIEIVCSFCGKKKEKRLSHVTRQKKRGCNNFYCDRKCFGKANYDHLKQYNDHFKKFRYKIVRVDEYTIFRYHLRNAKMRSKKCPNRTVKHFDLNLADLKDLWETQNGRCAITNIELTTRIYDDTRSKNPYQASLDRIDNSKGYIKENIRWVCLMFNYARNNFSDDEVLDFCLKVAENKSKIEPS